MVSMKEVAEQADVSVATVSRVLANKPHVRQEVREHVLRVVETLGYRRNRIASSLRSQTSGVIGLLVSDIRNPFFTDIARAIEDVAQQQNMSVFLCNTDESPEKELRYLNTLLDERVAGIILSPTPSKAQHFQFLLEHQTPVVMIDRRVENLAADYVLSDNAEAAYALTTHLLARGSKRIGAIMAVAQSTTGRERMTGYQRAMDEHKLVTLSEFVLPHEDAAADVVVRWLSAASPPDAIITGNIRLTVGALNAIKAHGVSIPEDVRLAGFDETVWMQHLGPGITVVSQPTYEMGRSAAELLIQRIQDNTRSPREVILKGELILRDSSR